MGLAMRMDSPIRVFLVAPALLRWGLERLLSTASPEIELSGSACSILEAEDDIESHLPDVVVVDSNDCSAADVRRVCDRARVKILALASAQENELSGLVETLVDTRQSPGSFVRAIVSTAEGSAERQRAPVEAAVANELPLPKLAEKSVRLLTRKQRQVVEIVVANPSAPAKVLAEKLGMSDHTLRNHLTEIYSRLGVNGRNHLQSLCAPA